MICTVAGHLLSCPGVRSEDTDRQREDAGVNDKRRGLASLPANQHLHILH